MAAQQLQLVLQNTMQSTAAAFEFTVVFVTCHDPAGYYRSQSGGLNKI